MNIFKHLTEKTRVALEQTSHAVRDKMAHIMQQSSLSIEELASFIIEHPNTTTTTKDYLGIHLTFYNLQIDDLAFYMEKKGYGSYILQLVIQDTNGALVNYFSYKQESSTRNSVKLPNSLREAVK